MSEETPAASTAGYSELFADVTRRLGRAPRLLLLAASFRPALRAGSPRTWNIAVRLRALGWHVTVVASDPAQLKRSEPPAPVAEALEQAGIRRILAKNRWPILTGGVLRVSAPVPRVVQALARRFAMAARIDPESGWVPGARKATAGLRPGNFDLVLASVPSFAIVPFAAELATRLECPFAIDYRDLWTLNPMVERAPARRHVRAETDAVRKAAAVVVVSHSSAELMADVFGAKGRVHVVTNGFSSADVEGITPFPFDHFAIIYAGALYRTKRTIDPLMRALASIETNGLLQRGWRFHYYGPHGDLVRAAAEAAGLSPKRVEYHGNVPRRDALAAVAGADLVTVVTTSDAQASVSDRGIITGKIFEAICLRRQMLVIAPPGSDVEQVVAVAGGGKVIAGPDTDAIAQHIAAVGSGRTVPLRDPGAYDWETLAPRLGSILLRAVETRGNRR